jgi:hypothetical protein
MAKRNLFIVGLDEFNLERLLRLPQAKHCDFHAALRVQDIRKVKGFDMPALIDKAIAAMEAFDGPIDGVASYWDFPGTVMVPILARRFGLPGPSLEAVLKCEHKYWSRLEQREVIPDHIPRFDAFDPFDDDAYAKLDLVPPFWVKPFKSFRSFLAFHIHQPRELRRALPVIRARERYIGEPFRYILGHYGAPESISGLKESFIAESVIGGAQCTLEGYVHEGAVSVYGVVDSVRQPHGSSFSRYEYPSSLPLEIKLRMADVIRTALERIGLDNSPFNAEFFYDQSADHVWLLEINPRSSQAHSDIFEKVHGFSHLSVMVDLALGRKPAAMERSGPFNVAAHFMVRVPDDGRVARTPGPDVIDRLRKRFPDVVIDIAVEPGQRLSELQGQDMYSYELASVFVGGRDQEELLDKYDLVLTALQFEIEPV